MMKSLAMVFAVAIYSSATCAQTPEAAWKADLAKTNKDYSVTPHAILKIQDAAYLGEGQSAALVGQPGRPETYKWVSGAQSGALVAHYSNGKPQLVKDGKTLADPLADVQIDKDIDVEVFPTQVAAGVSGIRIFVFNQQNPAAKAFKGVDYFPYDASYVVKADFVPDPKLPGIRFMTSRGTSKEFFRAGVGSFDLAGKHFSLPFYADTNDPHQIGDLSAFFTDDLTGNGTYGAGRYVDVSVHGFPPKTFAIDFNYAYNPNCARSAFFTCPVAFDHLTVPVRAGEKDPHAAH